MTVHGMLLRLTTACVVSLIPYVASAAELQLPARKPGLWELKRVSEASVAVPQMTMQLCLDAATDHDIMAAGLAMSGDLCPQITKSQSGDVITIDATCDIAGRHTVSHTTISGDFQSAYTLKVVSDSQGGSPMLPPHSVVTQQARWLGACTAGMQPGEMTIPGGRKVNVLNALKKPGG